MRPEAPEGRCCDVCDPETIGLPDPTTLTPPRKSKGGSAAAPIEVAPADAGLVEVLRQWRATAAQGKPAYTVAHNRTLAAIARRRPETLSELAEIAGVGPAFIERHGSNVLALVADARAADE